MTPEERRILNDMHSGDNQRPEDFKWLLDLCEKLALREEPEWVRHDREKLGIIWNPQPPPASPLAHAIQQRADEMKMDLRRSLMPDNSDPGDEA